jgi:Domain of unknown function (DUF4587)
MTGLSSSAYTSLIHIVRVCETFQYSVVCDSVDMMEMMMVQNAQMHQLIMQQLMLSALPSSNAGAATAAAATASSNRQIDVEQLLSVRTGFFC